MEFGYCCCYCWCESSTKSLCYCYREQWPYTNMHALPTTVSADIDWICVCCTNTVSDAHLNDSFGIFNAIRLAQKRFFFRHSFLAHFPMWQFCYCMNLLQSSMHTQLTFCHVSGHKIIKNVVWLKHTYVKWYNWNFWCMLSSRLKCYVDFNKHPRMVYARSCVHVLVDMKVNINIYQSSFFLPLMLTQKRRCSKWKSEGICVHLPFCLSIHPFVCRSENKWVDELWVQTITLMDLANWCCLSLPFALALTSIRLYASAYSFVQIDFFLTIIIHWLY